MGDTDDNGYSAYGQGVVWVLIVVIFLILRMVMRVAAPAPPFVRVQPVPSRGGGYCAEVWLKGEAGDSLTRLTEHGRHGEHRTSGVALMRARGLSPELPTTAKTAVGTCRISRYHLLVDRVETDSVDLE